MIILTQLYRYPIDKATDDDDRQKKTQRQSEIETCFLINVNHEYVKGMYVFLENMNDKEYYTNLLITKVPSRVSKVTFVDNNGKQAHYKDFLLYARANIPDNEVICILASDIYMNFTNDMTFFDDFLPVDTVFGITRHEPTDLNHTICNKQTCDLAHSTGGCGDCFILRTPVPKNLDMVALDHRQNRWGGECNFLHQFYKAGSKVFNPCFQVKTIHLHKDLVYFSLNPNRVTDERPYLPDAEPCPTDTNHCINRPSCLYNPGTVKCFRCKAWPNIFCKWHNGGRDWVCSVCDMYNAWDQQHGYRWRAPMPK